MTPACINDLVGKPYLRGARGPAAFDCWGLVLELARRCALPVPADWLGLDLDRAQQRALMALQACRVQRLPGPAEGAIAYAARAGHAGLVLHGRVVHAQRGAGVVAWPVALWLLAYPGGSWHAWPM